MKNKKAVIFGIKGYKLSSKEKELFNRIEPWGIILFSRNVKNINQLKNLVNEIKKIFRNKNYPILIDQEGGKVSRLNKIIEFSLFSQGNFDKIYKHNKRLFFIYYKIYIDAVSNLLNDIGININTVPVLDVRRKKSHDVIGSRSFSSNVNRIISLGNSCINLFNKNKIATVIKHIPGHGLSQSDSHYHTPVICNSKKELINKDFKTFKKCSSMFAMTAHVIYKNYDPNNTATHSKTVINKIVRNHIKFNGILISDDISMKSLKYKLEKNALMALKSGCNLTLHCNGKIKEMNKLAKVIPSIDKFTQKKTSQFYKFLG